MRTGFVGAKSTPQDDLLVAAFGRLLDIGVSGDFERAQEVERGKRRPPPRADVAWTA